MWQPDCIIILGHGNQNPLSLQWLALPLLKPPSSRSAQLHSLASSFNIELHHLFQTSLLAQFFKSNTFDKRLQHILVFAKG